MDSVGSISRLRPHRTPNAIAFRPAESHQRSTECGPKQLATFHSGSYIASVQTSTFEGGYYEHHLAPPLPPRVHAQEVEAVLSTTNQAGKERSCEKTIPRDGNGGITQVRQST